MGKSRIEAFSDGVIAIIITIMVLELKTPHGEEWSALRPLWPTFLSYLLSFINLAMYWNNHHHMFQAVRLVDGGILWANLHLLFWLSLMPFATAFMGENQFAPVPVALYATDLFLCALAYFYLVHRLVGLHGTASEFAESLASVKTGKLSRLSYNSKVSLSLISYGVAIPMAFLNQYVSLVLVAAGAAIWFIPDRRFETR